MSKREQINKIIVESKKLRQQIRTPSLMLQNYLNYQHLKIIEQGSSLWSCGLCASPKVQVSKQFKEAFKKLDRLQKAKFYLINVKSLRKVLIEQKKSLQQQDKILNRYSIQYSTIQRKVLMKGGHKLKKWTEVTVQIFEKQKIFKILETKEEIALQFYLMRRSKNKNKIIIVLEPVDEVSPQLRISQSSTDFEDLQKVITSVWANSQQIKIRKMLAMSINQPANKNKLKKMKSNITFEERPYSMTLRLSKKFSKIQEKQQLMKQLEFLAEKQSISKIQCRSDKKDNNKKMNKDHIDNNYFQQQLVPDDFLKSLSSYGNFEEQSQGTYYDNSGQKVRKIFTFNSYIPQSLILNIIDNFRHIRKRKDTLLNVKVLNSLPTQQTNIYQEIHHFGEEDIQFIFFRHYFNRDGVSFYIEKSIDLEQLGLPKSNQVIRGYIEYCIWRVRSYGNQTELLVEAEITYPKRINNVQDLTSLYIGQFVDYINKKCIITKDSDEESVHTTDFENEYLSEITDDYNQENSFFTVSGSIDIDQLAILNYEENISQCSQKKTNKSFDFHSGGAQIQSQVYHIQNAVMQYANHLKCRYIVKPLQKGQPHYYLSETGHPIWGNQWIINPQGYLVNMNHQKIKMQSSVLKLVIQRMGRNLFSGKSILNMSLPIQIFGTDSNLERLAKGYTYAPRFLEKAVNLQNPVDRIKHIVCFALGFSLAYIQMEKPFNPIIGQTYQGLVDGCPVYGQQTSHHPPISSLYMKGRGYTIYGNFEAKVEMGVNSASGINDGFTTIVFDKYNGVVRFNNPPGQISGLVFGDRKLAIVKKSYLIDQGNRLFVQISWGKKKSGRYGLGQYNDYLSGVIAKIKSNVDLKDYKRIKPSDYECQLGEVYGRVNDKVFFQKQELFDMAKDLPYKMEDFFPCLESDSRIRQDISIRKTRDYVRAHQAKQQLENIQRRDRKLRQQYKLKD